MYGRARSFPFTVVSVFLFLLAASFGFTGCSSNQPPPEAAPATPTRPVQTYRPSQPAQPVQSAQPAPPAFGGSSTSSVPVGPGASASQRRPTAPAIMLGIDVLASQNFSQIAGKRIGLLSHPAGVTRYGESTIDVLRRAPNAKLVALFGPEHGIYGTAPASENVADLIDKRTGLPAYSLHGKNRRPTKEQLKNIDALVIDLQDIGVRSYTFSVCMKYAIEACFENNVEVIVLDRPNPLGGVKVDGPILEKPLFSGVGQYQMPYVHGLTMGELARMAAGTPGWLEVSEPVRAKGRLTVVPMRGWKRTMRWPETGLRFTPTSPYVQDFSACVGYAMTGLGCQIGGFKHGIGTQYPFRGLSYKDGPSIDELLRTLTALRLPGLGFRKVALTDANGAPKGVGIHVDVTDWDDWRPTELSFNLMLLACKYAPNGKNPFAAATLEAARSFNIHTGSLVWWNALKRDGARVDLPYFMRTWQRDAQRFREASRRFWLYGN